LHHGARKTLAASDQDITDTREHEFLATQRREESSGRRFRSWLQNKGRTTVANLGLWVALGGGIGAVARFAMAGWMIERVPPGFPWPTFTVNVLGSAALGLFHQLLPPPAATPRTRAFFTIGLCGGFTTFSAFDLDTLDLLRQARYSLAMLYSLGTTAACITGVLAGLWLGMWLRRPATAPGPEPK
jgi:CrcB protein